MSFCMQHRNDVIYIGPKSGRILEIQVHSLLRLLRGRDIQPKLLFKPATVRLVYEERPFKRVQRRMFKSSATHVISQIGCLLPAEIVIFRWSYLFLNIDLVTVFDAILTSRQTREKL